MNDKQKELLDKGINDDHILAEILIYINQNPSAEIVVIAGDYYFLRRLKSLNIKTIDPEDDKYLVFFKTETPKIARRPDLQLLFRNGQDSIELNIEGIEIKLMEYEEEEEEVKDIGKIIANLTNPMRKPKQTYIEEIEEYNKKLVENSKYKEISFELSNNANHPYKDIYIFITAELEQGFDFKFKEDLPKPEKPSRQESMLPLLTPNRYIFPDLKEPEEKHNGPKKTLTEKGTVKWILSYRIKSLNHQLIRNLGPILIKIPEDVKTNVISIYCDFAHEEPGKIKTQKLTINLKK